MNRGGWAACFASGGGEWRSVYTPAMVLAG